jgi:hypothetical protein
MGMAGLGSAAAPGEGVGPDEARVVGWAWELQLFAPFRRFRSQKKSQRSLIPLNFVRPVTPKVTGSSPVATAISISTLVRASYSDCNFLERSRAVADARFHDVSRQAVKIFLILQSRLWIKTTLGLLDGQRFLIPISK